MSGEITPLLLVKLPSDELASEQVMAAAETIQQDSLKTVFKPAIGVDVYRSTPAMGSVEMSQVQESKSPVSPSTDMLESNSVVNSSSQETSGQGDKKIVSQKWDQLDDILSKIEKPSVPVIPSSFTASKNKTKRVREVREERDTESAVDVWQGEYI